MSGKTAYRVSLSLLGDYQFLVSFGDLTDDAPLIVDEPPPLGGNAGPSPPALLAAAAVARLQFAKKQSRLETRTYVRVSKPPRVEVVVREVKEEPKCTVSSAVSAGGGSGAGKGVGGDWSG